MSRELLTNPLLILRGVLARESGGDAVARWLCGECNVASDTYINMYVERERESERERRERVEREVDWVGCSFCSVAAANKSAAGVLTPLHRRLHDNIYIYIYMSSSYYVCVLILLV